MASSNTEIANLALSHVGTGAEIANLETENSQEANAVRRFYDNALDTVLSEFPWPFTIKFLVLALVQKDPTAEWKFSYTYPPDCLNIQRILSGIRNEARDNHIPYRLAFGTSSTVIFTDMEDPCLEFVSRVTDVIRYPANFARALSYQLAYLIAPRLTSGDPFKLQEKTLALYYQEISVARARAINEEQPELQPDAEHIREREQGTGNSLRGDSFTDFIGIT